MYAYRRSSLPRLRWPCASARRAWRSVPLSTHVPITRIDAIAYGTAVSWVELEMGVFSVFSRRVMAVAGGTVVAASTTMLLSTSANAEDGLAVALAFSGMPLGFAVCMPWFARLPALAGIVGRLTRWTSELSYSLYLVHLPLNLAANELGKQWLGTGGAARALSRVAALAASVVVAWALHTVVERPMMRLRRPEL
jgi:peptidoglycan/LPS O-acetylase OafA/YrhL